MTINLLVLNGLPILDQLRLEEALLRTNDENWCILNTSAPKSIVMGISTQPKDVVDFPIMAKKPIPLIRRFSGGGTVVVDEDTIFASFIFQKEIHDFIPYPKTILHWMGEFYKNALKLPTFQIQDNDFALLDKKIGGNAQYIRRDRFLHHTTFLWDFCNENMEYLLHPPTEPSYRKSRPHKEFLTTLKPLLSKLEFQSRIISYLKSLYTVKEGKIPKTHPPHRTATLELFLENNPL